MRKLLLWIICLCSITAFAQSTKKNEKVYQEVEQMPCFPDGDLAWMQYLTNNTHYPKTAYENEIQGRVVIGFVVCKDGTIADVVVERSINPELDKEALRVVNSMPKWIPGKQNGKNVNVKYRVPITFRMKR